MMDEQKFINEFGMTFDQAQKKLNEIKSYNQNEIDEWIMELNSLNKKIPLGERVAMKAKTERLKKEFRRRGLL